MTAERKARVAQPGIPAFSRADCRRVVEQSVFFLLLAQARELRVERVIARHERFLAVEDRRVRAGGVFQAVDLAGAKRELDAPQEGRVGIGLEVRIDEIRNLAGEPVQLDQVGPVDLAQVRPSAPLVNAKQRVESLERAVMNVEGIRQQLADR